MVVFLMETNANTSYRNRIKGRGGILWKGSGGGGTHSLTHSLTHRPVRRLCV